MMDDIRERARAAYLQQIAAQEQAKAAELDRKIQQARTESARLLTEFLAKADIVGGPIQPEELQEWKGPTVGRLPQGTDRSDWGAVIAPRLAVRISSAAYGAPARPFVCFQCPQCGVWINGPSVESLAALGEALDKNDNRLCTRCEDERVQAVFAAQAAASRAARPAPTPNDEVPF